MLGIAQSNALRIFLETYYRQNTNVTLVREI